MSETVQVMGKVSVDHDSANHDLVIGVWNEEGTGRVVEMRVPVQDTSEFLADVARHTAYVIDDAAKMLARGECSTCRNVGLVKTERHGKPWSEHCPDCRSREPRPTIGTEPKIAPSGFRAPR
jgi:hypothetical protein